MIWALAVLATQDDPAAVERLVRRLSDESVQQRDEAARELIDMGERAVPSLQKVVSSEPEVRSRIALILTAIDVNAVRGTSLKHVADVLVPGAQIHSAAFSPDGKLLATGGDQGDVIVWDPKTGERRATLEGHTHWVGSLLFNPDGKRLYSAAGGVRLWDVSTGRLLAGLEDRHVVRGVSLSPDGARLAVPIVGAIQIRSADRLELMESIPFGDVVVESAAFSPDGTKLAAGNAHGSVKVFGAGTWEELHSLKRDEWIRSVVWVSNERLAFRQRVGDTELWSPGIEKTVVIPHGKDSPWRLIHAGTELVWGDEEGRLHRWDLKADRELGPVQVHASRITTVAAGPDGSGIAIASEKGPAILWDRDAGQKTLDLVGHAARIESPAFTQDGAYLVARGEGTAASVFDASSGKRVRELAVAEGAVLVPGSKGPRVYAVQDGAAEWDAETGESNAIGEEGADRWDRPNRAFIGPDRKRIVVGGFFSNAALLELETGVKHDLKLEGVAHRLLDAAFRPDGAVLALALAGGNHGEFSRLSFIRPGDRVEIEHSEEHVRTVAFSPNGKTLVWAGGGKIHVWDAVELAERSSHEGQAGWWRFIDDRLAVSTWGDEATFWHVPTLTPVKTEKMRGHIYSAELSPDRRRLAIVVDGSRLAVYEVVP